jgi:putative endonuclease
VVNTHIFGQNAENLASEYLSGENVKVVDRNYRTRFGEIDIIGRDGKQIVFFEVKAKSTSNFGKPYEMVTARKKRKIISTAKSYLLEKRINPEGKDWRIDVISIDYENGQIEWMKNAVIDE